MKFVLGVSASTPTLAIHGETGEIPLSLKMYRLALNFWHRVTSLPGTSLSKIALRENIEMRSNWIITIEKLIGTLKLADKTGNVHAFQKATKLALEQGYIEWWGRELKDPCLSRLSFLRTIKSKFEFESYLQISNFGNRKLIAKLRCSNHPLEIEKGRHKKKERSDRKCLFCDKNVIEDEKHFLLECDLYYQLKHEYNFENFHSTPEFFENENVEPFGDYLFKAFALRENHGH